MSRGSAREVRVGLVMAATLAGILFLLALARGGPGFLTKRRTVDVVFRDGQGVKIGSPVRIAGIESGRVMSVDLAEVDGTLRARVRLALPADLVARLKVDARITVQSGLTGQSFVNVVGTGRSKVPLVSGQVIHGVETSMFDPIMEQVGLGPVERSHLSHTIAEVRETVDAAGPRLRSILASLQETAGGLRETAEKIRPAVEGTAGRVENLARRLDESKLDETCKNVHDLTDHAQSMLAENRAGLKETLDSIQDLITSLHDALSKEVPKVDQLLSNVDGTRARLDGVLENTRVLTGQGAEIMTKNRANIERIVANGKDATDYGVKLVQKLYGNPFYLSPFYKPTRSDVQAQEFYDVANSFLLGAKELNDAMKILQVMREKPNLTPSERQAYGQLYQRAYELDEQLKRTAAQLGQGVNAPPTRR